MKGRQLHPIEKTAVLQQDSCISVTPQELSQLVAGQPEDCDLRKMADEMLPSMEVYRREHEKCCKREARAIFILMVETREPTQEEARDDMIDEIIRLLKDHKR